MFVPFDTLPLSSRIWVYQADRALSNSDVHIISTHLEAFTHRWTAHNQMLMASFCILHDYFVVLAVNEEVNQASGCSIDDSVRAVRSLAEQTKIDFFNRTNVAFLINDAVQVIPLSELSRKLEEGMWNSETLVFNNTIASISELKNNWCIPAGKSWLKRYLEKAPEYRFNN